MHPNEAISSAITSVTRLECYSKIHRRTDCKTRSYFESHSSQHLSRNCQKLVRDGASLFIENEVSRYVEDN